MSETERLHPWATWLVVLAAVAALAASTVLMLVPVTVIRERSVTVDRATGAGPERTVTTRERAVDNPSPGTVAFFGFPVAVAAAPLLARRRRRAIVARAAAAGLLLFWVLFLAFGGGEFYLPAAALMAWSAAAAASRSQSSPTGRRLRKVV